jgi:hypothetical protein
MNLRGLAISWENVPGYFDFADIYAEAVARAPPIPARRVLG